MLDEISTRVPTREELDAARATLRHYASSLDNLEQSLTQVHHGNQDLAEPLTPEQAWLLHDFADATVTYAEITCDAAKKVEALVKEIWLDRYDIEAPHRLTCAECGRPWRALLERWRSYLTVDDEARVWCPSCAEREFGGDG